MSVELSRSVVRRAGTLVFVNVATAACGLVYWLFWRRRSSDLLKSKEFSGREISNCACVQNILKELRSIGGASLRGHTLGVPNKHRGLIKLSVLVKEYCDRLGDDVWTMRHMIKLQMVSGAIVKLLLASDERHLVLEFGAGRMLTEVTDLELRLTEVLDGCPYDCDGRAESSDSVQWMQMRIAEMHRFREGVRNCLKAANPWVLYD
mmetsp:Transcript_151007/g.266465  ORF Transcript_151007/g.266465 Transcript_151007/m.266465 type:complete len:206 (-) Transcript_151007:263-880(-)